MVAHPLAIRDLTRYLNGCSDTARAAHAPLFAWADSRVLTRRALLSVAVRLVARAGIHLSKYQGISFRRGGATSLAMAGRPDRVIQILGRWKSHVFKRYIEQDTDQLVQAATGSSVHRGERSERANTGLRASQCLIGVPGSTE